MVIRSLKHQPNPGASLYTILDLNGVEIVSISEFTAELRLTLDFHLPVPQCPHTGIRDKNARLFYKVLCNLLMKGLICRDVPYGHIKIISVE